MPKPTARYWNSKEGQISQVVMWTILWIPIVWVSWPWKQNTAFFIIAMNKLVRGCVQSGWYSFSALLPLCGTSEKRTILFVRVHHSFPTPDTWLPARTWWSCMTGRRWWACWELALTYDALESRTAWKREENGPVPLRAPPRIASSRNDRPAFKGVLIWIWLNPLFCPQWIHR